MNPLWPILTMHIRVEQDVVSARQRARQISSFIGFDGQDQTRISTAVSELARNAFQYASDGRVEFLFDSESSPQRFLVSISDSGPGIGNVDTILNGEYKSSTGMGIGLCGSKKLMDHFEIESARGSGTRISIGKDLLKPNSRVTRTHLAQLVSELLKQKTENVLEEVQRQNRELLMVMETLQKRQDELSELNRELVETNRGVVALYAELDEKAISLQAANEIKTNFLSHMTHEFRTPLTSIISLTRLLLDRIDGELTDEQEKQVRYIRQSSESLLELVSDLLDLAKVEAGKVAIKPTEFEISHLLSALRGVFRPLLRPETQLEFQMELLSTPQTMFSDEAKIAQILRNLIANAIKFTPEGTITVSVQHDGSDTMIFEVADTGIGIEQAYHARIFEDFGQVDSFLQKTSRGTGLGLPLSRKLSRLLGGDLTVKSAVGKGSVFSVRLPRAYGGAEVGTLIGHGGAKPEASLSHSSATQSPATQSPATQTFARTREVLLVDDDEASRYVLKTLISTLASVRFIEASSGSEGLRLARERRPSMIFLDLSMPGMSGFEVLRELKSDVDLADIPVAVNTAKILSQDERDVLSQLAVGVLSKDRDDNREASVSLKAVIETLEAHG